MSPCWNGMSAISSLRQKPAEPQQTAFESAVFPLREKLAAASALFALMGQNTLMECAGLEAMPKVAERLANSVRLKQRLCALVCEKRGIVYPVLDDHPIRICVLVHHASGILDGLSATVGLAGVLGNFGPLLLKADIKLLVAAFGEDKVTFALKNRAFVEPLERPLSDVLANPACLIAHGWSYVRLWLALYMADILPFLHVAPLEIRAHAKIPPFLPPELDVALIGYLEQKIGRAFVKKQAGEISRIAGKPNPGKHYP